MTEKKRTYAQMSQQLADIIDWFEGENVDLDAAIVKYDQAVALIAEMEKYLRTAENKINKITTALG